MWPKHEKASGSKKTQRPVRAFKIKGLLSDTCSAFCLKERRRVSVKDTSVFFLLMSRHLYSAHISAAGNDLSILARVLFLGGWHSTFYCITATCWAGVWIRDSKMQYFCKEWEVPITRDYSLFLPLCSFKWAHSYTQLHTVCIYNFSLSKKIHTCGETAQISK